MRPCGAPPRRPGPAEPAMAGYTVLVNDNSHYMDEGERYKLGDFSAYDQALAACMRLVDDFLEARRRPGMSAPQLFEQYTSFGEDPFVVPPAEPAFSAWDYARNRCEQLCN